MKICSKFTEEHQCRSEITIKLQINFAEITLRYICSPVSLLHIFRTPVPKKTFAGLLLKGNNCLKGSNEDNYIMNELKVHSKFWHNIWQLNALKKMMKNIFFISPQKLFSFSRYLNFCIIHKAMCRGELSAAIARLMSKCLWSGWKWQRGVK